MMKRNGSQILGLFGEMSTMLQYSQLDLYKQSGSVMDRKTLITLNGVSSWSPNYRNYTASMKETAFNMSGFIQPSFAEKMLLSDDADGFNDRQLFVFPPQRNVLLDSELDSELDFICKQKGYTLRLTTAYEVCSPNLKEHTRGRR